MLENFNGIFYLVIFLIILAMNAFYAYNCLFNTKNFISKYGVDVTAAFFARFAGAVILGAVLMQLYILFRGTAATIKPPANLQKKAAEISMSYFSRNCFVLNKQLYP